MKDISLKDLLEAGCHFGHQTNRWHPKAAGFIYGVREGVHIIDLVKTREGLLAAAEYLKNLAKNNGTVVFVGTKRQAQQILADAAAKVVQSLPENSNFYSIIDRWPGGFLTNFVTIKHNNLDTIVKLRDDINNNNFVTKKEKLLASRKLNKYTKDYGGVVGLTKLPDAIFVLDIKREDLAVKEAVRTNREIVAIVDTNTNPDPIKYQVPANDDAVGSVKVILDYLVDAWIEGRNEAGKATSESVTNEKPNESESKPKSKSRVRKNSDKKE
ncbi:30S ribosomal protein S2 [Candidatus Microgenomates bacterium]|nr:30S ribosomal protein S2 [Candidatus Microgenomates bacterium]